ncbi:GCG_CRPN prefix-to-repeats domain-containing protein [Labrys okinawensis]|uniref:GCG_CRPN prefix-to-repeats domain-containing protein n=1 Tax=Labrys okinawensis TaxID=346911 RepID=UPI0039BD8487
MHKTLQKTCIAAALALAGAFAVAASASAMPVGPAAADKSPLLQDVRDGCGRGYRPNDWGRCVPERYPPRYDNGYGDQRYGGGYDNRYREGYGGYDGRYREGYGYDDQPPRRSYRNGCPPGRHPGNSGRCVKDY